MVVSDTSAFYHYAHNIQKKSLRIIPALLDLWDLRFTWDAISVQELLVKPDDSAIDGDGPQDLSTTMQDATVVRGLGKGNHILIH